MSNKQLTKEECLKTLEDSRFLEVVIRGENGNFEYYSNFEDTVTFDLLKQLINEHFDNPPLKFEELENSWVWDNKYKGYIFVGNYRKLSKRYRMFHINDEDILYLTEDDFEENRFYRCQVKENE